MNFSILALTGYFLLSGTGFGVNPPIPVSDNPTYTVRLSAYNAVVGQTDSDPFTTASGAYSNPAVVAARSRDLAKELPFGTIIKVSEAPYSQKSCGYSLVAPRVGYRVIADTMNARFSDSIDILIANDAEVMLGNKSLPAGKVFGVCHGAEIEVVGRLDSISKIPSTQRELTLLVEGQDNLALK